MTDTLQPTTVQPGSSQPTSPQPSAVLDDAHVGDIRGALGTIKHGDIGARRGLSAKVKTLLAIVGPGLIVMCGDNDAGAFSIYGQAGQNYGTHLLWVLPLLIPVLYVNQEMAARLGAVTGVGHGKLIIERFGRFWGAFSVIDLFLLNALTLVTEFIGITLAVGYLGLPKAPSVIAAGLVIVAAASTGSFRRFERLVVALCAGTRAADPDRLHAAPDGRAPAAGSSAASRSAISWVAAASDRGYAPGAPWSRSCPARVRQQLQVLGGGHAGLGHEPGGLRDGQRQVAELPGEPVRVSLAEPGHPVRKIATDSARASTSTSTGTAISAHSARGR